MQQEIIVFISLSLLVCCSSNTSNKGWEWQPCLSDGTCHANLVCDEDICVDPCRGRICGDDGYGRSCGMCPGPTDSCTSDGFCLDDCAGRICGSSPVESYDCGSCYGSTEYCNDAGRCIDDCDGRVCGDSPKQGFNCGECRAYEACNAGGNCICEHASCIGVCCAQGEVCFTGRCCLPKTCQGMNRQCGAWPDGCGADLDCGPCSTNEVCDQSGECICLYEECNGACCVESEVCFSSTCCTPDSCQILGVECGTWSNGCGGEIHCESCSGNLTCVSGSCEDIGLRWVSYQSGTFMMGTDSGGPDEWPQHPVTINAFEMTATEITFSQYIVCVDEGICTEPDPWPEPNCHWGMNGVDDYPVDCVDWFQSIQFCSWVGGRLPTEAEWEYAARNAGMVIDYPWGLDLPTECVHANYNRCAPVVSQACSYPQGNTGYGLCDLAGNLAEWTQDCLQGNYIGAPTDGSAWEECVDENHARVVRGGSWVSGASDIRTYSRGYNWPFSRNGYTGIRCVKDSIP